MRDGQTTIDARDPWASGSTIHAAPVLEDGTFDPEKATLMFLPSKTMIANHHRRREGKKRLLLLLAMLLILGLELARVG
jgi:hypothetical protein